MEEDEEQCMHSVRKGIAHSQVSTAQIHFLSHKYTQNGNFFFPVDLFHKGEQISEIVMSAITWQKMVYEGEVL